MNLDRARDLATVESDLITWMAVHGNLLLALRHPKNVGPSGELVRKFAKAVAELLVDGGLLTPGDIDEILEAERKYERGTRQ